MARRKGLQTFLEGEGGGSTPEMKKAPRGAFAVAYGSVSKGFPLDSPVAEAGGNSPPLAVWTISNCTRRGKRCGDSPYSVGGQRSPRELSSPQTTCAKGGSERFARGLSPPRPRHPRGGYAEGCGAESVPFPPLVASRLGGGPWVRFAKKKAVRYFH